MISLFSGIGGFSLAALWAGIETVAFCELDPFCRQILKKHWPDVPVFYDVRRLNGGKIAKRYGPIDLVVGGVPCQPASQAGQRKGDQDDRWLWDDAFRIVREVRPTWCVFENVYGLVTLDKGLAFERLLAELEGIGYEVQAFIIPACAVNAPHRRDRVWIVANAIGERQPGKCGSWKKGIAKHGEALADARRAGQPNVERSEATAAHSGFGAVGDPSWWDVEPAVGRVAHGVPGRVDRLKALGNAVLPELVFQLLQIIKKINEEPMDCGKKTHMDNKQ